MALFSTEGETVSFTKVRLALVYEGGWQAHPLGGALPPPRTFTRRVVWIVLCVLCLPCVAASAKKGVLGGLKQQCNLSAFGETSPAAMRLGGCNLAVRHP